MKAVILAAGIGKRFKPVSDYIAKEMLPLANKRFIIEHILEELYAAGVREFILVVSEQAPKYELRRFVEDWTVEKGCAPPQFASQRIPPGAEAPLGTADALWCARGYLRGDFFVYYGDDLWVSDPPRAKQLRDAHERWGKHPTIAAMEVSQDLVSRLGILHHQPIKGGLSRVWDIKEKPDLAKESLLKPPYLATISGMILNEEIFAFIRDLFLEKGIYVWVGGNIIPIRSDRGEVYLTEVLNKFAQRNRLFALKLRGRWVDCGTWEDYLETLRNWPRS